MSRIAGIAAKFMCPSKGAVVRVKGCRWSNRYLTLYFPEAVQAHVVTIPFQDVVNSRFSVVEHAGAGVHDLVIGEQIICRFTTSDRAMWALNKICNVIAPSRWRHVRRLAAVALVYMILTPSSNSPQQQMSAQLPQPPMAAQVAPGGMTPAMPVAQQRPAPQRDQGDPFGLILNPTAK